MARQALTDTPTTLAGLTSGTTYYMQNRSGDWLWLQEAAAAPTDPSEAFVVKPFGDRLVQMGTNNLYVWNRRGVGGIIFDEAPG